VPRAVCLALHQNQVWDPRPSPVLPNMLIAAFIALGIAVSIGSGLAIQHLRTESAKPPPWPLALLHVIFAVGGLGCLVLALRGPPRGLDQGTGSFGIIAAALIVMAAFVGGWMLVARIVKRRPAGILIGMHATLAVVGFVILTAYVFAA
jgi:hypothetical protein